jgi:hypothetical protein
MDDCLLQFLTVDHLRPKLRPVAEAFSGLTQKIATTLPRNPERTAALRRPLEAKDCAVRARLYREPG